MARDLHTAAQEDLLQAPADFGFGDQVQAEGSRPLTHLTPFYLLTVGHPIYALVKIQH